MPNFKSVVYNLVVDFGGGCRRSSCSSSSSFDRGKTKSTPCLTWTELLCYDWSLTISKTQKALKRLHRCFFQTIFRLF